MAVRVVVDLKGMDEKLRRLTPEVIRSAIGFAAQTALAPVVADAQSRAPVRTGKLRQSVQLKTRTNIGQVEVTLGTGVPYGHLLERGHNIVARGPNRKGLAAGVAARGLTQRRKQGASGFVAARPFAVPAYQAREAEVRDTFERAMFAILGLS